MLQSIGEITTLLGQTLAALPLLWRQRDKVAEQFFEIGNASLFLVCLISFFLGGVLSLQTGPILAERGMAAVIGSVIGNSMVKEIAPVMISMLLAGRVGSAMAAELGSMRVYQEIDALRTMNISPVHFLVLPRLSAIVIALPLLVVVAILAGWFGGAVVAATNPRVGLSFEGYFFSLREGLVTWDVANGLIKSVVFATVIGLVSCHQGLSTVGGPRGIGRAVTQAVVVSLSMILILDYFLTRFLMNFD
jgi:phospholipid/cholesterol/gamma-HCH transport system permease protein